MHEGCAHCSAQGRQTKRVERKGQPGKANPGKPKSPRQESGNNAPAKSELLTRKEAAAFLGLSEVTLAIWKSCQRYDLPVIKVGRLAKYRRSDLEAFLDRHTWDAADGNGGRRE